MECNHLKFVWETNQFLSWNKPSKQKNFEKINVTFLAEFFCKKTNSYGSNSCWNFLKFCFALFHSFEAIMDCLEKQEILAKRVRKWNNLN